MVAGRRLAFPAEALNFWLLEAEKGRFVVAKRPQPKATIFYDILRGRIIGRNQNYFYSVSAQFQDGEV